MTLVGLLLCVRVWGFAVCCVCFVFFSGYGDHRYLHVLTHSFPTRRSSDLCAFAMGVSARKPTQALLLIQLKIIQRLGYFELLSTLPRVIVDHVCSSAQVRVPTMRELKAYDARSEQRAEGKSE